MNESAESWQIKVLARLAPGAARDAARLGLTGFGTMLGHEWADLSFDRRHGVETAGIVKIDRLGFADPDAQRLARRHKPSPPLPVARALAFLARETGGLGHTGLVEYGCGAGRVMVLAAKAGLGRAIGLELSRDLLRLCRANLARYAARRPVTTRFEILEADAARYDPPAEATLFYLFRPFLPPVFDAALARIRASAAAHPRDIYLMILEGEPYDPAGLIRVARVHGIDIWSNRDDPAAFLAAGSGLGGARPAGEDAAANRKDRAWTG